MAKYFDARYSDDLLEQKTWEEAESCMLKNTLSGALTSAGKTSDDLDLIFSGDLLNQCISTTFAIKDFAVPFFGIFGACSTMCEGMSLGSMAIDGKFADNVIAVTAPQ